MWAYRNGRVSPSRIALCAALVIAGCGSGDDSASNDIDTTTTTTTTSGAVAAGSVVDELAFLGDLAVVEGAPISVVVDASPSTHDLPDGSTVVVASDAFPKATTLTATVATLDFTEVEPSAPSVTIYALSTEDHVDLATPVTLEVVAPPAEVTVTQQVDGVWQRVDLDDVDKNDVDVTRIPITGFSTVLTAVMRSRAPLAAPGNLTPMEELLDVVAEITRDADQPEEYLKTCASTLYLIMRDLDTGRVHNQHNDFVAQIAASFCTRSVIDRFSVGPDRVEVSCVGERVAAGLGLQAAIDECSAEPTSTSVDTATEPTVQPGTADATFPLTYRGDGLHRLTFYDSQHDRTDVCEQEVSVELKLENDGSAVFTYSPGLGIHHDGDTFECREIAGNAWPATYDRAAGTFTVSPPAEDSEREFWDVGGDFDAHSAFGPAGYARRHPFPDGSGHQLTTHDFEFSIPPVP